MTEEPNSAGGSAEPATTESRGRGRPSNAEIEARTAALAEREARLKEREAEIAEREAATLDAEKQAALDAAEANLLMREADAVRTEAEIEAREAAAVRASSPRASVRQGEVRAEVRAEPIADDLRWPERKFKGDVVLNQYDVPLEAIPPGMSYQWNNHTVLGATDTHYDNIMAAQGWRPVPASRHPDLVPAGVTSGHIVVGGQILVERPMQYTEEAKRFERQKARDEVLAKEEQLYGTPPGTMQRSRANGSNEFIGVKKEVEHGVPVQPQYQYENTGGGLPVDP